MEINIVCLQIRSKLTLAYKVFYQLELLDFLTQLHAFITAERESSVSLDIDTPENFDLVGYIL